MATTTEEVLAEWRDRLGAVPAASNEFVCKLCLGPVSNYSQCYGCKELFLSPNVPRELRRVVVPMTSVLNPSPWYGALVKYKGFERQLGTVLVSVAYHFLEEHRDNIAGLLGGEPTMLTIVPSKRGFTYDEQPLRAVLSLVEPLGSMLRQTLQHVPGSASGRRQFHPEAFTAGPTPVRGERIILIEDTWVTGATAVSAAGALLDLGATSVAVLPIARVVDAGFWNEDHPYRVAMQTGMGESLAIPWPR